MKTHKLWELHIFLKHLKEEICDRPGFMVILHKLLDVI